MGFYLGLDIGAISATAALLADGDSDAAPSGGEFRLLETNHDGRVYLMKYRRTHGRPVEAATEILDEVISAVGADAIKGIRLTGSGSELIATKLNAPKVNEFKAAASGLSALGAEVNTVFEMGGESSKYLQLQRNDGGGYGIADYATNGDCAAGTGSFIDQQAGRLNFEVEDIGQICLAADRSAQIAGRCSVFAKSDMIHAQQKGYGPVEVLRGLCDAVARNFRAAVVRSHPVEAPVAFIGGLASNEAVVSSMREVFELDEESMFVPHGHAHVLAIGAAAAARAGRGALDPAGMERLREASDSKHGRFPTTPALNMDRVVLLRDRIRPYEPPPGDEKIDAYMGIDIGSVSTNVVVIDEQGQVIKEIYTKTRGRPIEVVGEALREIEDELGDKLNIRGVGTTGSGRELVGVLIGADTINDEITAHKTGATFVGRTMLEGKMPDTIFEIGGQDSKYISLEEGVVVDFTMNDACAAGTGSFLEERAEELGISIKDEFAELALSSEAPIRLGERCTVFMERDVNSYLQRGAEKPNLVAGLAYSVVYNYINRVVRGRKIGESIFFQGGTAYNDSVAAAFASVLDKDIVVPPHNGVIGAIGAGLLAMEKMAAVASGDANEGVYVADDADGRQRPVSKFRGYDLDKIDYKLREFTCKGCSNHCQIQEFTVEGEKTYWGDKCSQRFRKEVKAEQKPVIEDLLAMRNEWLMDDSHLPEPKPSAAKVGVPLSMFALEMLPFWRTFLAHCGYEVVLSEPTNRRIVQAGLDNVVAEPCFPIIAAHGHVAELLKKDLDYIFLPNLVSMQTQWMQTESHLCPWHQTLPFVIRRAPRFEPHMDKFISPTLHFREGRRFVRRELQQYFKKLGVAPRTVSRAIAAAFEAQDSFAARIDRAGRDALETLKRSDATGIVLVGRPYNVHDAGINLAVGRKLRDHYGVNVIPLDFLPVEDVDITDLNDNMYWTLGRRVIAAADLVGQHPNLHIICITNFKCGPDSFVKHFIRTASGKPFLTLQFDGHSNDAGMMTRCEAYLDSKRILRPWREELQLAKSLA